MRKWSDETNLCLLTPEEYAELPDGTMLLCIDDETYIKGKDYIDNDTRYGYLAYGLTPIMAESQGLMHKFVIWTLQD